MELTNQDILESLKGDNWPGYRHRVPSNTRIQDRRLADVETTCGDDAMVGAVELINGGQIKVWFEDLMGNQFDFELSMCDFRRAIETMESKSYGYTDHVTYQRDLLIVACWGATAFRLPGV